MPSITYLLGINALLFCIGFALIITKKNVLFILKQGISHIESRGLF